MADRFLRGYRLSPPQWPIDLGNNGEHRKSYIEAIKEADKGDLEPLISFMEIHGAKDHTLGQLLGHNQIKKQYRGERLEYLVKASIRRGCNVNDIENNGHLPLNIAIKQDLKKIISLLLDSGAQFKDKDRSGLSPFECAVNNNMYEIAYEMYKRGYPYAPRHPNTNLKVSYQNLCTFDKRYF